MLTESIKWDHSQTNIEGALGVSRERGNEITASIFFVEIDKAFTANSLFDDEDEIPAEFRAKTAVLDSVFDDCKNSNEIVYATYEWTKHSVMKATSRNYEKMLSQLTMLYMMSGQNKEKFTRDFCKKVKHVDSRDREEEDED